MISCAMMKKMEGQYGRKAPSRISDPFSLKPIYLTFNTQEILSRGEENEVTM